jgi:hypothetical protein
MNRHPVNVVSLVFGLLFLGVSALWGLVHYDVMGGGSGGGIEIAVPIMLVSIGLAGLMASISKIRSARSADRHE